MTLGHRLLLTPPLAYSAGEPDMPLRSGLPGLQGAFTPPGRRRESHGTRGRSIAIGSFDGLHLGHQALLTACQKAAEAGGLSTCVLSFHPHPRGFFQPDQTPARLLPLRDKALELAALGIEEAVLLRFNRALASTSAEEFVADILVKHLDCQHVVVGEDFRFGARRQGDVGLLQTLGAALGFGVTAIGAVCAEGLRVSSSQLREALKAGDLAKTEALLGRRYRLSGRVRHGQKLGRTLGFPTLNIAMPSDLAARGIFAVEVEGLNEGPPLLGVASLGRRPTVEDQGRMLLEVFVFDWQGDAYGRRVRVTLRQFIRPEVRFDSLEAMTLQMHNDLAQARAFFRRK
ncbi:MAG: bifunctional riboflavin kinase/FAD synthetase [Burkholderiaceae bacterium]